MCLEITTAPPGPAWPRQLERGNDLLLDIDVQGAAQVRRNMPQADQHFHTSSQSGCAGEAIAQPQPR